MKATPTLEQANDALDALATLEELNDTTSGLIAPSYVKQLQTMRNSIMRRVLIKKEFVSKNDPSYGQRAFDPILRSKK